MQDRLKFRIWDKQKHTLITYEDLTLESQEVTNCYDSIILYLSNDNYEYMQCTGFHAVKSYRGESEADRLIFEGDILQREIFRDIVIGEVVWSNIGFTGFVLKVIKDDMTNFYSIGRGQYDDDESDTYNDEIIGNIHNTRTEGENRETVDRLLT